MGTGVRFRGLGGHNVKLTTYIKLVQRLKMFGTIPLLLVYALMAWEGKTYFTSIRRLLHERQTEAGRYGDDKEP